MTHRSVFNKKNKANQALERGLYNRQWVNIFELSDDDVGFRVRKNGVIISWINPIMV